MKKQNILAILLSILIIGISAFIFNQSLGFKTTFNSDYKQNNQITFDGKNNISSNAQTKNIINPISRIFHTYTVEDNIGVYISPALGITFEYVYEGDVDSVMIMEDVNSITVGDSTKITVFEKDPNLTLKQAIEQNILKGYDPAKCWVVSDPLKNSSLYNYNTAQIEFPEVTDLSLPWWHNAKDCPPDLTTVNGVSYYLYDPKVPEKFAFVNKGQAVAANAPSEYGNHDFGYTIKFMPAIESKINSFVESGQIQKYILSPDGKHAFVEVFNKSPSYHLYNLETGKSIFPDEDYNWYYVYGLDEINDKNLVWHENNLFVASRFSSHGAEGFPGIVKVDLNTDTPERIVDFTNECPFTDEKDYPGQCIQWYKFEIKNIEKNKLIYIESFDEQNEPYTKYNYSVEKTITF